MKYIITTTINLKGPITDVTDIRNIPVSTTIELDEDVEPIVGLTYRTLWDLPSKGTTETISFASVGKNISSTDVSENELELQQDWLEEMQFANTLPGTLAEPMKLWGNGYQVGDGTIITTGDKIIDILTCDYYELYDLVIKGNDDNTINGINGIVFYPTSNGTNIVIQRVKIKDIYFGAILASGDGVGEHYNSIEVRNVVNRYHSTEGEFIYNGNTGDNPDSEVYSSLYIDCGALDRGREQLQLNNHRDAKVVNFTGINGGAANQSGQRSALQFQNCFGFIINSIFQSAPKPALICGHGTEFRNVFFEINEDANIFVQKLTSQYPTPVSEANTNRPIVFRNCIFRATVTITELFNVAEDECDLVLIDCIFDGTFTSIFNDGRTDQLTYQLLNINPTYTTVPTVTYSSSDLYSDDFLKITSEYHHNLGMGMRTPFPYNVYAMNSYITGTRETGQTLTANFSFYSPVGETQSSVAYQWYVNDVAESGETSSTFVIPGSADGLGVKVSIQVTGSGGSVSQTIETASVTIGSVFDICDITLAKIDDVVVDGSNVVTSWGDDSTTIYGTPEYSGVEDAVFMDSATPEAIDFTKNAQPSDPYEIYVWRKPTETGSFAWFLKLTSGSGIDSQSSGEYRVYGTKTGVSESAGYDFIRVRINGASSFIQINNGSKTTFSDTASIGLVDTTLGSNIGGTTPAASAYYKFFGIASGAVDDADFTAMYNALTA